jgi:uncharacterized membrane protein (DUF485 family)
VRILITLKYDMTIETQLLRSTQHALYASHQYQGSSKAVEHTIILLVSYVILVAVAAYFLRYSACNLYELPISPTERQQTLIKVAIVILLGILGVFALFDDSWTDRTWFYYAICNLLVAAFIYVYQLIKRYVLYLCTIMIMLVAVDCALFAHSATRDSSRLDLVINLVGAVEGWAVVWAMYVFGQLMVYNWDISRKSQNYCFFILAVIVVVLWTVGKKLNSPANWLNFLGFWIVSLSLLALMFVRQKGSFWT